MPIQFISKGKHRFCSIILQRSLFIRNIFHITLTYLQNLIFEFLNHFTKIATIIFREMNKSLHFQYDSIGFKEATFIPICLVGRNYQIGLLINLLDINSKYSTDLAIAFERKERIFIIYFDINRFGFSHNEFVDNLFPFMQILS